ncbi:MAG: TRAP transporter large permease subunit [Rhodospirillaceae bacterium]|jgi:tripartite ATP-independent transporter DctM subunit|nr:TRAP transporter large permease subunit [Rhodospirillaceae bacterium]
MEFVELLPIVMLGSLAVLLFSGLPVALLLAGLGVTFALLGVVIDEMPAVALYNIPVRMFRSVAGSLIYPAVAMLLFMSVALEKSGIAKDMLVCLNALLKRVPGGLAIAVTVIGILLAPAAGLVGASVVTLALVALPTMLAKGYRPELATGSVAAAGTLGIVLPPAVMLFFLASQFRTSIGGMFVATLIPGIVLVVLYISYYVIDGLRHPAAPEAHDESDDWTPRQWLGYMVRGLVLPAGLLSLVLGSIIFGWATPPQSGAVGAAGGLFLMFINGRLNWATFKDVASTTALMTAMVFFIIMAATVFSYPFRYFEGDQVIAEALRALPFGDWGTLIFVLGVIFVLGFFIDWIEITVITLPLFVPLLATLDFSGHVGDPATTKIWMATLVALTLQTSFLTPPFGFALFFLKGAAPPEIQLIQIYRGAVPVIVAQVAGIMLLMAAPILAIWLPGLIFG